MKTFFSALGALLVSLMFLLGCTESKVEDIHYGKDYCDHCKMQITDKRYGGAILTTEGRTLKFDAVECLAASRHSVKDHIKEIYFVDFETAKLVPQNKINLYKDDNMHGPMGTRIQGYSKEMSLPKVQLEEVGR